VFSWYLQLSNVKPTQVCSAPAGRKVISTTLAAVLQQAAKLFQQHWRHLKGNYEFNAAFEKADRLQRRTGGQFHKIAPIRQ
jgi:hypothetical protein